MKKVIATSIAAVLLSFVPATAFANSYNGATVAPEADNKTYKVTAEAGDTITLTDLGNTTSKLSVTVDANINGQIIVEEATTKPAEASSNAPGILNLYFNVTLVGLTNADITGAKWTFSVEKSWMTQNGVTAENVFLHHYNGTTWERLNTRQVSSTATTVTFEADVSSFSPFAVSAVAGLSNTGSPYMVGAILGVSILAILGGTFVLSRKRA